MLLSAVLYAVNLLWLYPFLHFRINFRFQFSYWIYYSLLFAFIKWPAPAVNNKHTYQQGADQNKANHRISVHSHIWYFRSAKVIVCRFQSVTDKKPLLMKGLQMLTGKTYFFAAGAAAAGTATLGSSFFNWRVIVTKQLEFWRIEHFHVFRRHVLNPEVFIQVKDSWYLLQYARSGALSVFEKIFKDFIFRTNLPAPNTAGVPVNFNGKVAITFCHPGCRKSRGSGRQLWDQTECL